MPVFSGNELAGWTGGQWENGLPPSLNGISNDTRNLPAGSLYVAIKGRNFDGHAFVERAFAAGAAGALVASNADVHVAGRPLLRVGDTMKALYDMARGYRAMLGIPIVGITGSVGKTTVKEMTAAVLSAVGSTGRTLGNWNNDVGLPLSLLSMERDTKVGVLEAGTNHPGELAPLCALLKPAWGMVTNVGPVHIEFFGTQEAIACEKAEMLRILPPNGTAVLCLDGKFYDTLREAAPCRVVTVSLEGKADYYCRKKDGLAVAVERTTGEEMSFAPPLSGDHNLVNILFAVAAGRGFGAGWDSIRTAIENYKPLPHRWNREHVRGVLFIDDAYNANPVSMKAAIDTFAGFPVPGRKWLVLGDMLELGAAERELHEEIGKSLVKFVWGGLIVVGSRGRWIADGAEAAGLSGVTVARCANTLEAAAALSGRIGKGDAVLLKASRGMKLEETKKQYVLLVL